MTSRKRWTLDQSSQADLALSLFETDLGWCGMIKTAKGVAALTFGHQTPGEVHERLLAEGSISRMTTPMDWSPELRERLQAYAAGDRDDFADVAVCTVGCTVFQRRVLAALRNVGYGQTVSYAELAARAVSPQAARAVGRVMATNRVPLIVPCHRVVGSGGRLGGFSAPSGLAMKRRLLELEGAATFACS